MAPRSFPTVVNKAAVDSRLRGKVKVAISVAGRSSSDCRLIEMQIEKSGECGRRYYPSNLRLLRSIRDFCETLAPIFLIMSNMKWQISQIKSEIFHINIKYSVLRPRATMLQGSQEVKFAVARGTEVHQVSSNFLGRSIFRSTNK